MAWATLVAFPRVDALACSCRKDGDTLSVVPHPGSHLPANFRLWVIQDPAGVGDIFLIPPPLERRSPGHLVFVLRHEDPGIGSVPLRARVVQPASVAIIELTPEKEVPPGKYVLEVEARPGGGCVLVTGRGPADCCWHRDVTGPAPCSAGNIAAMVVEPEVGDFVPYTEGGGHTWQLMECCSKSNPMRATLRSFPRRQFGGFTVRTERDDTAPSWAGLTGPIRGAWCTTPSSNCDGSGGFIEIPVSRVTDSGSPAAAVSWFGLWFSKDAPIDFERPPDFYSAAGSDASIRLGDGGLCRSTSYVVPKVVGLSIGIRAFDAAGNPSTPAEAKLDLSSDRCAAARMVETFFDL